MPIDLILVGAGGHAKVVLDALRLSEPGTNVAIVDEDNTITGKTFFDIPIGLFPPEDHHPDSIGHIAIGDNTNRRRLGEILARQGIPLHTIRHPAAIVSGSSQIGQGTFLAVGSIIGPLAQIGIGVIINHAAVVDHDCRVGDYTHIASNASLGGGVKIGEGCLIGVGASILPDKKIGDGVIVGAGAVVVKDIAHGQTVTGIPAKEKA